MYSLQKTYLKQHFKLLPFWPSDILLDVYVTSYCFTLYTPFSHFSRVK